MRSLQSLLLGLAVAAMLAFVALLGPRVAAAQEADCQRISYNERIVIKCTTKTDRTAGSASATPVPSPTPTPTSDGEEDSAEQARAQDGDDELDVESDDGADQDRSGPDRGDRGGRVGSDIDPDGNDADAGDSDEDHPAAAGSTDDAEDDASPDRDEAGDSTGAAAADPALARDGFDSGEPSSENGTLPVVAALATFALLGGGFALAARRTRSATVT